MTTDPVASPVATARPTTLLLAILTMLHAMAFIDRQVMAFMVGPIKADMAISDTEMSLLLGPAFGLFFALAGLPMGLLADRSHRIRLVAVCSGLWSLMTAGCGLAANFLTLLLCRIGVGVGEAGLSPAAYSLLADTYPRHRLSRAIAIYAAGIIIGSGLAYLLGGYLVEKAVGLDDIEVPLLGALAGWQLIFVMLGLIGLAPALVMLLLDEPAREPGSREIPADLLPFLRSRFMAVSTLVAGFSLLSLLGYASAAWIPTMMVRVHGFSLAKVGLVFGLSFVTVGVAGTYSMAALNDILLRKGRRDSAYLLGAFNGIACIACVAIAALSPQTTMQVAALVGYTYFASSWTSIAYASLQIVTPANLRGRISAIYLMSVNIIGLTFGPLLVGLCTDYLFADEGQVGWSIIVVGTGAVIAAVASFLIGAAAFRRAVETGIGPS